MLQATSERAPLEGRFRVENELARGGMGAVFAAIDVSTGRRVALKRLTPNAPPRVAALFEREFYVLSSLKHPRIIEVYDYGFDAEGPYYTMELLEGSDLRELSPLAAKDACLYLRDVASSLALLHARRLLHRDVSPRNVRTLPGGRCKLIDFGALTSFGTSEDLVGTPPAIPPEALSAEPMDQRADLFSLGALAYYVLTGRHAYPARKVGELTDAWREPPTPPSRHAPGIPRELDELVLSLLALDPLARPSNATDVIGHLEVIGGLEPERDARVEQAYFVGAALVERDRELERVERRLRRAKSGHGDGVYVDANPNVGKTRFLNEVVLKAQIVGFAVLRAEGHNHAGPFSTARALVQQLVRVSPKIAEKALAPHLDTIGEAWPEIVTQIDFEVASEIRERDAAESPPSLADALSDCFRSAAAKVPLLLAVDDVDRADLETVALLLGLSRAGRKARLVVLTTASARPSTELSPAVRALRDAGMSIRLRELTATGMAALVQTAFGDVPHARRTATRLYAATDGNPGRTMYLLQRLVDSGHIRYDAGSWTLPLELPAEALETAADPALDVLSGCSPDARRLAALLAIRDEAAPLDWFVAFERQHRSSRTVIAALEELVRSGILLGGAEGYWFAASMLCRAALKGASEDEVRALRVAVGEALLAEAKTDSDRMAAGSHFILGGEELRGADIIARAARSVVANDPEPARALARVTGPLESALAVYKKHRKSHLARLSLLVALSISSYEVSPALATRYGEETICGLERALGLPPSRDAKEPPEPEVVFAALARAPVLDDGELPTEDTPDIVQLISWFIGVGISLTAVASASIDHDTEGRFVRALRPFTVFGPGHPAAFAHDFCRLVQMMTEDRPSETHAKWLELLPRLDALPLPPSLRSRLRRGMIFALGVLECHRDDKMALGRIAEVEASGGDQSRAFANQLRFLYHGFRGETVLAHEYRDRVEEYAVQFGSAWQIEIWSTSTATAVYTTNRDVAGAKRSLEQLERLKKTLRSLEIYWERAVAGQYLLTGANERALEGFLRTLEHPEARERVGWAGVRGGVARAYNELGRFEEARSVCEETLEHCRKDLEYVMTLTCQTELARALAGLGETAKAKALLDELLARHLPNENSATLVTIHRAAAEVALRERDMPLFEQHLASMRRWALPTRNPALIRQCDQLRGAAQITGNWSSTATPTGLLATTMQTFVQSIFATCEGEAARKQRALDLVAAQAGVREAWLFTTNDGNRPVVVGRLGVAPVPEEISSLVSELFAENASDADETAYVSATDADPMKSVDPQSHRVIPLTVSRGEKRILVGAIALPIDGAVRPVSFTLVEDIAAQLFQAGDIATVRTFC